jgi:hypothetical protein
MKKKYRIYTIESHTSPVPDGYHITNYTEYAFTQKGYKRDYDSFEEAETALMTEPEYQYSASTYTIQPIYINEKDSNQIA